MRTIKLLGIAGSLRRQSRNKELLKVAMNHLPEGVSMEIADLTDVPLYNPDVPGKPVSVSRVFNQMEQANGFVFAATEYNYSLAPALKNILDWASREPENALLAGKWVAIMGAGGGMGSSRAQAHLRQVCVFLNLYPINKPEVFVNAFGESFDQQGQLVDEQLKQQITTQMVELVNKIRQ